jgi:hypothetical protein
VALATSQVNSIVGIMAFEMALLLASLKRAYRGSNIFLIKLAMTSTGETLWALACCARLGR